MQQQKQRPYNSGDAVVLHFFGSARGERGEVTAVTPNGVPLEFSDTWGNKIFPADIVHFHRPINDRR